MNYFYCPKCFKEDKDFNEEGIKVIYKNPRDGKGNKLNHIKCPKCGSANSVFMRLIGDTDYLREKEMQEYKILIEGYQFSYDTNREIDIRLGKREKEKNK